MLEHIYTVVYFKLRSAVYSFMLFNANAVFRKKRKKLVDCNQTASISAIG